MVFEGGDTNRNASRRCNGDFVVIITCEVHQGPEGLLKNGSTVVMRFHDFKYDLLG